MDHHIQKRLANRSLDTTRNQGGKAGSGGSHHVRYHHTWRPHTVRSRCGGVFVDICHDAPVEALPPRHRPSFRAQYPTCRNAYILQHSRYICLDVLWGYTFLLAVPMCWLALVFRFSRRSIDVRLVVWNSKLLRHNHTSVIANCSPMVWRPIWVSAASRKLLHAGLPCRTCAC